MTNSIDSNCPKCGSSIPKDAPQGLCPTCVLSGAATFPDSTTSPAGRTPPPTVEEVAAHFPDLEVVELIGAGGMGAVYKVRQPKLDRFVALKILSHDLPDDPSFGERFNREARVLARLNHPNIVTVFDFGTAGPYCYLLMEFVDGVNLRQAMRAGGFTPSETLALVQDVCAALKFAHDEGILHRDIKPENVLIDSRGRVKIADFGIAKLVGEESPDHFTLTMQGSILGSPQYMAPEQIESPGDVDQRADIYSLGVVFYEMLTGELPLGRFAPPSEKSTVDSRVDEIVMRTLEKERQARFQSACEVSTQVEAVSRTQAAPQGAAGPSAHPPVPAPEDPSKPAQFSSVSAILTGVSLVLAGVTAITLPFITMAIDDPTPPMGLYASVIGIGLLLVGIPAFLGIFFGAKSLGEIRRTGGTKPGLGMAMFGTLTWPVLLFVVLAASALVSSLGSTSNGLTAMRSPLEAVLVGAAVVGILLTAGFVIVAVYRHALGTSRPPNGYGDHPPRAGRALSLAVVSTIVLVLIPLGLLVFGVPQPGHETTAIHKEARASQPARSSSGSFSSSGSGPVVAPGTQTTSRRNWTEGSPEVDLKFTVQPGHLTTFELVRTDSSGQEKVLNLDWYAFASDTEPFEGTIQLGTISTKADPTGPRRDIAAHYVGGAVSLNYFATLRGDWEFVTVPKGIDLYGVEVDAAAMTMRAGRLLDPIPETHTIDLATSRDLETYRSPKEILSLRVVTSPRPEAGKSVIIAKGWMNSGDPAKALEKLLGDSANPTSAAMAEKIAKHWSENEPEIEFDFVAPAGHITMFELLDNRGVVNRVPTNWYVVAPDIEDFKGSIKVGAIDSLVVAGQNHTDLGVSVRSSSGTDSKLLHVRLPGEFELSMPPIYPILDMKTVPVGEIGEVEARDADGELNFSAPGLHQVPIARRTDSKFLEGVSLLVWSVPQPAGEPRVAQSGRIGPAEPADIVDRWVAQDRKRWQKAAKAPRSSKEPLLKVEPGRGSVLLRTGFMLNFREQKITEPTAVEKTQSLALGEHSIALMYLDDKTAVGLATNDDVAELGFIDAAMWHLQNGTLVVTNDQKGGTDLEIQTGFGSVKTSGASFSVTSEGKLNVIDGEVEVLDHDGMRVELVKSGGEFTPPELPFLEDE